MGLFSALPAILPKVDHFSRSLFLIGTGAITGLCLFDLLPDAYELGGANALYVIGGVWLLYSLGHYFHIGHHHLENDPTHIDIHPHGGVWVFFVSIFTHCFSSGMLLAVTRQFSDKIAGTVFVALAAHKGYEALMVSTVLSQRVSHRRKRLAMVGLYSLALPLGVLTTLVLQKFFHESWSTQVAVLVSSVALGTLLGCVVFDFLIPSLHHLRKSRLALGWIAAGLILTQIIVKRL